MTDDEFRTLKARIFRMFPSVATWGRGLSAEQRQAIGQRWQACLARFDAQDAHSTLDDFAAMPDSPWPYASDYERIGAIIAKATGDRLARLRDASASPLDALPAKPTNYRSLGIMSRVSAAIEADTRHSAECLEHRRVYGRCLPECPVRSLVGRELAAEDVGLEPDGQRFSCHLCRDTGFVSCLRSADVASTIRDGRVPAVRRTYSVVCECSKGLERDAQSQRDGRRLMERYNPVRDVRVDAPDDEIVTTCRALAESGGGRRVAAFDEFNCGGVR